MKKYAFILIIIALGIAFWYVSTNSYKNGLQRCESDYIKKEKEDLRRISELQANNKELTRKLNESLKNEKEFKEILNTIIPSDTAKLYNNL